jgi:sporulation protein YlmC with PRC-barrel domain
VLAWLLRLFVTRKGEKTKGENMFTEYSLHKTMTMGVTTVGLAAALSLGLASAYGQTTGSKAVGVNQQELRAAERGWSAKKNIMDKAIYNDNNEKIGNVDDVIFSRNGSASFAIVGAGGFLGMGKHDVAVPLSHIKHENDKLVLPGATKEALKAMPEFQYAKSERTDTTASRR